ncbi:MAG TPA: insulinase family protein [Gemmatimonadales bacterium]|jgi:predicted Zn-dependent peptidase
MKSLTLLLGLSLVAGNAAAQFPTSPPPAAPVTAAPALPLQPFVLANGLKVNVLENHRQPVVSMALSLPAGSAYDPPTQSGTADLLASLLTRGAGSRDADSVSSAIEQVGGSLSATVDPDFLTLTADALSEHVDVAMGLLADAVLRPHLDPQEVDKARAQAIASVQADNTQSGNVASRIFLAGLYGDHPYAIRSTPATLNNIGRKDLEAFRLARFRPSAAQLVIAGDITLADARKLVTAAFGEWKGVAPAPLPAKSPVRAKTRIILVHIPSAETSSILMGNTTMRGGDSTYYAATVVDRVFGGGTNNRLVRVLRDEKRWTESPASALTQPNGMGMFQIGAEVRSAVTDSAVRELLAQMRKIRSDTVAPDELKRAQAELAGSYPADIQSMNQQAGAVLKARRMGRPASSVTSYPKQVASLTATRFRTAAKSVVRPDSCLIVVVGNAAPLYKGLSAIAPIALIAPDGTQLTPADLEPKTAVLQLDSTLLVPRKDSLLVVAQGRTVGVQVSTLERTGDGLLYTETTNIGNVISQTSKVSMDLGGRMRSLAQTGKMRGQDTKIDLAYGPGKVKGSAHVLGPKGPINLAVDTIVPAGILDDNALQALFPALNWAPNVRWTIPVFASGQNRVRTLTLTVRAMGTVSVPAGSFQAYMADLEGDDQKVTFYISVDPPHRLLRLTVAGTPLEFVAVPTGGDRAP